MKADAATRTKCKNDEILVKKKRNAKSAKLFTLKMFLRNNTGKIKETDKIEIMGKMMQHEATKTSMKRRSQKCRRGKLLRDTSKTAIRED